MLSHKLMLEDVEDDYHLMAIHSSLEEYKMAYLLNKHLHLNLHRAKIDVDYNHGEIEALYPLYVFNEPAKYRTYYLVKNKYKGPAKKFISSGSLFIEEEVTPQVTYLIPEFKDVDYFLKVEEDLSPGKSQKLLNGIASIANVITTYTVDTDQLKTKNNLIFN